MFILNASFAQDTVKVRRSGNYNFCTLLICQKNDCYSDSIPLSAFISSNKYELRINDRCAFKKHSDVFVRSFEIEIDNSGKAVSSAAPSSFLTSSQKRMLNKLQPGNSFWIRNIVVHGPDEFRNLEDQKIFIK
jgi:hypothetical protein